MKIKGRAYDLSVFEVGYDPSNSEPNRAHATKGIKEGCAGPTDNVEDGENKADDADC